MLDVLKHGFLAGIWFFDIDHKSNELYLVERVSYRTRFPYKGFTTMKIYGKEFYIPSNAEEMVQLIYGDDWRTPIEGWSHPHICDHHFYKKSWFSRFIIDRWIWIHNYRQVRWRNFIEPKFKQKR